MYLPSHFEEQRVEVLHQLIRERPLGTLVTLDSTGLNANHIPFEIGQEPEPWGTLRGHVARANPVWRDSAQTVEALVVFLGAQTYVTPSWYQTKSQTGEVVPTFNYLAVHAYGPIVIHQERDWLRGFVTRLTHRFEAQRAAPWQVSDAPEAFIEKQLGAIVGIEIPLTRLIGKWKVSQNRPAADRDGVVRGLNENADADSVALARWVTEKSKP
jgi:transcriptional regulator